ncbi:MAG: epoxyqueuosine reductase [Chloroflexota bacterium]|nr:epoxyqueuosine reductase [Chloroflexota bacterium]
MSAINETIKAEAHRLGFSFLHITRPARPPHYPAYLDWLAKDYSGEMRYLSSERAQQSRGDPASLLPKARSMLVFGVRYASLTRNLPAPEDEDRPQGLIASYALHADYHDRLKQAARRLMDFIQRETGREVEHRIFVDSSALLEKDTAFMAGAGWIGRNSLLITPHSGSLQVLGVILTDLDLPGEPAFEKDLCGNCHQCQVNCPTGCITGDRNLRAEHCIAYLTIEYKGIIPRPLRAKMGNWVYGCDVCQNMCPWNDPRNLSVDEVDSLPLWKSEPQVDLLEEIQLDEAAYKAKYAASPVLRASHTAFQRNLIVAMGNSASAACLPVLEPILTRDPNALLRQHAAWAIHALHAPRSRDLLQKALSIETDADVRAELAACLAVYE